MFRRGEKVFIAHDNPRDYIGDPMPYTYLEDMPDLTPCVQLRAKVINPYGKIEIVFESELKKNTWEIDVPHTTPDPDRSEDGEAD